MPTCPDREEMELLLLGRLSDERLAEVESHLDACRACQDLLGELNVESRVLRTLQEDDDQQPSADPAPEVRAVIARIEELAGQSSTFGSLAEVADNQNHGRKGAEDLS